MGDPLKEGVEIGAQQNKEQFEKVMGYMKLGKEQGGNCLVGGNQIGDKGYFVEPTVWGDVKDHMVIATDEIFGPSLQLMKYSTIDEAIARANDSEYGLAAG